jgi:4-hydroxymandelate oxidase
MSVPLAKLQRIPDGIGSVSDYEQLARERVTPQVWSYFDGGAADEWTLRDNRAAFQRVRLKPRILQPLSGGSTEIDLFGARLPFPLLLAPVAYQRMLHDEGELGAAIGASANRIPFVVSTQASTTLEEIAGVATCPLWFQLYIQPDRDFTAALVQRAERAGYRALVVTVDAPVQGIRNREQRAGFAFPDTIQAVNLRGARTLPPHEGRVGSPALLANPLLQAAPGWGDLSRLRAMTKLPVLLKGILSAADAERAVAEGFDGIIVSNHGGRALDTVPATLDVLPGIADAVAGRVPVLFDGGIRRGSDIFKALAFGARAVLVGRPFVYGLAAAGALGVAHVLHILRAELENTMVLAGCVTIDGISRDFIERC